MKRREFLQTAVLAAGATMLPHTTAHAAGSRPNILWISCEDMSPDLGCYGDEYAVTPNLDALAAESVVYTHCFAHAPVCAPARSGIITGCYPSTMGTQFMRCKGVPQDGVHCFTEYLRAAGYYCTNKSKTDYQFSVPFLAWDESSNKAHWRNRSNPEQPFFSVVNFTTTHESQNRSNGDGLRDHVAKGLEALTPEERHDPAEAPVPDFYPDTPNVRADIAQHYDTMTVMDKEAGRVLAQLEEDGLRDDTIVIFWSDHGRGMPRYKRWPYDSGLHVAMMVHIPEKWRVLAGPGYAPGTKSSELVSFVDYAPTMLNLAGIDIPEHMQGQAFLGPKKPKAREYIYAARDRMDERIDMIRTVRDKKFIYIRNYMPHLPYAQTLDYMERMPTMKDWRQMHADGELNEEQALFFREEKPVEELYDCIADPDNVHDLANDPAYADTLRRMRAAHEKWVNDTRDVGLIPEPELDAMKWPSGKVTKANPPQLGRKKSGDGIQVALRAANKESLGYAYTQEGPWYAYSEPIVPKSGETIYVKAGQIGFEDSNVLSISSKGDVSGDGKIYPQPAHWSDLVRSKRILEKLRAIKRLDYEGADALPKFRDALSNGEPSVVYWAVIGVMRYGDKGDAQAMRELLGHESPSVRIAAAQALGSWGYSEQVLPLLTTLMLEGEQDSTRHYAANAIDALGEAARPAVPELKKSLEDKYKYVARVSKARLLELGEDLDGIEID